MVVKSSARSQWRTLIERRTGARTPSIVLCSCKKITIKQANFALGRFLLLPSSPRPLQCLTTLPTQYLTQPPSTSRLTRDRLPSSLTSPNSPHCPVQCPGCQETRPPKPRTLPLPLPFGYPSPSSTTSSVESNRLLL